MACTLKALTIVILYYVKRTVKDFQCYLNCRTTIWAEAVKDLGGQTDARSAEGISYVNTHQVLEREPLR